MSSSALACQLVQCEELRTGQVLLDLRSAVMDQALPSGVGNHLSVMGEVELEVGGV